MEKLFSVENITSLAFCTVLTVQKTSLPQRVGVVQGKRVMRRSSVLACLLTKPLAVRAFHHVKINGAKGAMQRADGLLVHAAWQAC